MTMPPLALSSFTAQEISGVGSGFLKKRDAKSIAGHHFSRALRKLLRQKTTVVTDNHQRRLAAIALRRRSEHRAFSFIAA